SPWTHAPICTDVLQSLGSKLCVYTNTSFSNGRGISIFTTPTVAAEFASLPAFQDPAALANVNIFSGNWYTQELPGKGMGVLASQHLNFGDRVTAYTPALLAHPAEELSTMDREKYFRIAVDQLPAATRDSYLQLSTIFGIPEVRVQDIVKANTFQLELGGQNHLAVFPETSRLNHACSPNAQYYLDPSTLTHFVHATRPIAPNEEITISYISPLDPTATRQDHLLTSFHFTCTCRRCATPAATDSTLHAIAMLQQTLGAWTSGGSHDYLAMAESLIQTFQREGLEGFLDVPYGHAALAYNAVGDVENAVRYAEMAAQAVRLKDGAWTENLRVWEEVGREPRGHWSYRRR
ncbi:hypothetical protein BDV95DRAFT_448922, partial [Massariosphaeria phaeospora]